MHEERHCTLRDHLLALIHPSSLAKFYSQSTDRMCFRVNQDFWLFFILITLGSKSASSLNFADAGSTYGLWNKTNIPYYLDEDYSASETILIRAAISAIMRQLDYCVMFSEVDPSSPVYKVHITPLTGQRGSPPQSVCFTPPGVDPRLVETATEQVLSIARGPQGCLGERQRSIMRQIVLLLGRRNEHQRKDRDDYIVVHDRNISLPAAYARYESGNNFWGLFPYDYCSLTHLQPTDFAKGGKTAFSIKEDKLPRLIPNHDELSQSDCKLISLLYSCDTSKCVEKAPCNQATEQNGTTTIPSSDAGTTSTALSATAGSSTLSATSVSANGATTQSAANNSTVSGTSLGGPASTSTTAGSSTTASAVSTTGVVTFTTLSTAG